MESGLPIGDVAAAVEAEESSLEIYYQRVRSTSVRLCEPLEPEDMVVQPVVDVSPPKWHLAHTTWFFEAFVLTPHLKGYKTFDPDFAYMFNSYYETEGDRVLRPNRGFMTRPTVEQIYQYRKYVDDAMKGLIGQGVDAAVIDLITLGLNHEQQHQELLITDLKYILGHNPLFPVYRAHDPGLERAQVQPRKMIHVEEGTYGVGFEGQGFHFDNELGRHKVYLHPYGIEDRLITAGEFLEFMEDGGYEDFRWWLSEGWDWVNRETIRSPMYWHKIEGAWHHYTLAGLTRVDLDEPVTHVSYFEAEAFATWKGLRLPTEFEWEVLVAQRNLPLEGNFMESELFHPKGASSESHQFYGDTWEWTASSYLPYPYFKTAEGAIGEYNGKFMVNQMVLRGGSCATAGDHIRPTYRNFFHPHLRWQFTGIRLAESR